MPRSKVSAFFSVLLVFVSGAAMGAVGYRLYSVKSALSSTAPVITPAKKMTSPEEFRKLVVNNLKDAVKLDDAQLAEVQKIYEEQHTVFDQTHDKYQSQINELPAVQQIHQAARHELDQYHQGSVAKIKSILRPDQQPLYEKWIADRAAERARKQQEHKDHPDGKQHPPMPHPLP